MRTFNSFLNEEELYEEILVEGTDDPTKEGSVSNNTKGVLHELLVGKHLNGGKHLEKHKNQEGETPQQAHDRLKTKIHPKDYERIHKKAQSAANHIKTHIESTHKGHAIHAVHWTSKPGDTEKVTGHKASQKEDSSDVYVTSKHPKTGKETHHGVSLKVSDKSSKNIPASSLGMKSGGSKANELYKEHQKRVHAIAPSLKNVKKKPEHKDLQAARKEWAKKNPKLHNKIKEQNKILLHNVAHHHAAELQHHLDSGNHEHVVKHIREVLHAHKTPAESGGHSFIKHTTYQTSKGAQHHVSKPGEEHEHILKDHKNIKVEASRGSVHFYHHNPITGKKTKFATQSHKLDSQSDPLSTLKSAGKAT
jgi:hypothetical protein